jgi:hypothetical protein
MLNRLRVGVSFLLAVTAFPASPATWADRHLGQDVVVHYVRLTGNASDSKVERKNLQITYDACSSRNRSLNRPVAPLPDGGIPEVPSSIEVQIYYSANRTVAATEGKIHDINFDTCALEESQRHNLTLMSAAGECRVDLIKASAYGTCDERVHRDAPAATAQQPGLPALPKLDTSRMSSQLRAQTEAAAARAATYMPRASSLPPTGETRQVAGEHCAVYRHDGLSDEKCIARPESRFFIPASCLNGAIPGLVLQIKSRLLNLTAQQVTMDMKVSESLFAVPPGVKIRPGSGGKP